MYIVEQAHGKFIRALGGSWTYETIIGKDNQPQEVQRVSGGKLKDIEHIRTLDDRLRPVHIAVAVLDDGCCFVGRSTCSLKDAYSRKHGYRLAVGRALDKAVQAEQEAGGHLKADFSVDAELEGRDLFRACAHHIFGEEE